MIDEFDTSKTQRKTDDEETEETNKLNSFSIIPLKNQKESKNEENENDFLGQMARYLRHNPWALGAVIALGACAISARIYLMHTTSLFF